MEDYSLNPYIGCSFDCSYCYINGSKYAKNTNSFYVKSNSASLLKSELKSLLRKNKRALISFGSSTDPYQDIESELYLTRNLLKLMYRFKFPVHIITKSDLVLRDIDILRKINDVAILPDDIVNKLKSNVIITYSFSTIDKEVFSIFEPNVPSIEKRFKAIERLKKEDFLVGVSFMPILPFIADNNESIDKAIFEFSKLDIDYLLYGSLSLFGNKEFDSRIKYFNLVKKYFPEYYSKTKNLFYNNRTGLYKDYPSFKYQEDLSKKIRYYSSKYNIKNTIF
ncbi:radical SAM protein [Methanobrevibacter sp. 87.7]|uniref:SPL family radical SAM protein n=1 Tax=Methanobrevibacter sp. 87.7 TaxID=387957 RepID=UPI000B501DE3|nr:radical SAM protein [Methanobrevibacter sp. 87.7]OWT32620.1 radical SAM protein [Methanobrevibacter sp. 87.7]